MTYDLSASSISDRLGLSRSAWDELIDEFAAGFDIDLADQEDTTSDAIATSQALPTPELRCSR